MHKKCEEQRFNDLEMIAKHGSGCDVSPAHCDEQGLFKKLKCRWVLGRRRGCRCIDPYTGETTKILSSKEKKLEC